ncbi:hypothetical protein MKZ38_005924 [Zalerion maritima]|uniref:Uncharacterized protein n=1 Tax=Zalerion maritima TaxID=339359 RepID=A0AAD5WVZ1_9PEZI|nr:hypothetical protein MKZ38_005924 [Zalerion maritima]
MPNQGDEPETPRNGNHHSFDDTFLPQQSSSTLYTSYLSTKIPEDSKDTMGLFAYPPQDGPKADIHRVKTALSHLRREAGEARRYTGFREAKIRGLTDATHPKYHGLAKQHTAKTLRCWKRQLVRERDEMKGKLRAIGCQISKRILELQRLETDNYRKRVFPYKSSQARRATSHTLAHKSASFLRRRASWRKGDLREGVFKNPRVAEQSRGKL